MIDSLSIYCVQPGGALEGVLAGTLLDPLNGTTATVESPGKGGESGSTYNAAWCSTPGLAWQGGNGCEFGAGGECSITHNLKFYLLYLYVNTVC